MTTPSARPENVQTPARVGTSPPLATPVTRGATTGIATTAGPTTIRGVGPTVSLAAPVERPKPPAVAKVVPVAACGDDDLMSQRQ
jgi:hypothetical protein